MQTIIDYIQYNQVFFIIYTILFPPAAWILWKYVNKDTVDAEDVTDAD